MYYCSTFPLVTLNKHYYYGYLADTIRKKRSGTTLLFTIKKPKPLKRMIKFLVKIVFTINGNNGIVAKTQQLITEM